MDLFSKDKETIFKIINAILLIWLIASVTMFFSSIIDIAIKEKPMNYEKYRTMRCYYINDVSTDVSDDSEETDTENTDTEEQYQNNCIPDYDNYVNDNDSIRTSQLKSVFNSLANVIVVAGVLVFLNKKKKIK